MHRVFRLSSVLVLVIAFTTSGISQDLRIDHLIAIESSLDSAIQEYQKLGFTIKYGRLHDNGMINAHIKFRNNSSFEIMSLSGKPKDAMAKEYAYLMKANVKGAFLALTGLPFDVIELELKRMNIAFNVFHGKRWSYITFPSNSEFGHIFFIDYHFEQNSLERYTMHENGIDKIESITIEGSENMILFLEKLGLENKRRIEGFKEFATKTGCIIIKPYTHSVRPRIIEVTFGYSSTDSPLLVKLY